MSTKKCLFTIVLLLLTACGASAPSIGTGATSVANTPATGAVASPATSAPADATAAPAAASGGGGAASGEKVKLRFAVLPDPNEEANVKSFVAAFNKKNPNVEVTVEQQTGDYFQKLTLQAASNTLPDLFWIHDQGVKGFAEKGLMLDLDPLIKASGLDTSNFYPSMFALGQEKGKQYMLPRDYNHLVTFYNVDMFKAAGLPFPKDGWTWQEFVDTATKLTKKGADGKTSQYGIDGSNFNWWAIDVPAIRGYGGEVVDENGKVVVDSPQAAQGIDTLYQLVKSGVATNYAEKPQETFNTNQVAMFFHVRPIIGGVVKAADGKFKWDVATFPKFPVKHQVGTGTSGYAISAKTPHPQEAWALLSFIDSEEGQRIFSTSGNEVPVLKSLQADKIWRTAPVPDINHDAFIKFPEADTLPVEPRLPASAGPLYDTARNELMEQVMLGKMTPPDMVKEWSKRINQAIQDAK